MTKGKPLSSDRYGGKESEERLTAALRGARLVGHKPMKDKPAAKKPTAKKKPGK